MCKPQAILVLGSSCLWPDHIPGLGAARPPAPFRAPFSDPDQSLACGSSQDLLVLSYPAPLALDGPWLPRQGSWSGLLPREGDSGVGQIRPCQIWSLLCVELVYAYFFFFYLFLLFFKVFKTYFERDKDSMSVGGAEREGERENPKQALCCQHRARRRARTHETARS